MSMQLQIPDTMRDRFEALAQQTGQRREDMMLSALEAYLAEVAEERIRIEEARAEAARGDVVDAESVYAEAAAMLLARGVTPEQLAAIKAEAEREADAYYGVSLCE